MKFSILFLMAFTSVMARAGDKQEIFCSGVEEQHDAVAKTDSGDKKSQDSEKKEQQKAAVAK